MPSMQQHVPTPLKEVTTMMIEAMRKLEAGTIDKATAQAMALCGKQVIDAHKAEVDTIATLHALQRGGIISDDIQYLEPQSGRSLHAIPLGKTAPITDKDVKDYLADG